MSIVPGGLVYKRDRNILRPASSGGVPPSYGLLVFYDIINAPVPPKTVMGAPLIKRTDWETYLAPGYDVLTFESDAVGTQYLSDADLPPVVFGINGINATLPDPNDIFGDPVYDPTIYYTVNNSTLLGRWNTTSGGSKWLDNCTSSVDDSASEQIAFNFASPISAFGAYFTDLGDFGGTVTLRLTRSDLTTTTYTLTTGSSSGSLAFWGFVDATNTYTKIEFFTTAPGDVWGMDDVVFGPFSILALV